MMHLVSPIKPYLMVQVPKEQYEIINQIELPQLYEELNLLDYLNKFCKNNNINIKDIFISTEDSSCYNCDIASYPSIYYKTYKQNKQYKSQLKKYNKELNIYNKKLEEYNLAEEKYQEDLENFTLYQARQIVADAEKKLKDSKKIPTTFTTISLAKGDK